MGLSAEQSNSGNSNDHNYNRHAAAVQESRNVFVWGQSAAPANRCSLDEGPVADAAEGRNHTQNGWVSSQAGRLVPMGASGVVGGMGDRGSAEAEDALVWSTRGVEGTCLTVKTAVQLRGLLSEWRKKCAVGRFRLCNIELCQEGGYVLAIVGDRDQ